MDIQSNPPPCILIPTPVYHKQLRNKKAQTRTIATIHKMIMDIQLKGYKIRQSSRASQNEKSHTHNL